MCTWGFGELAPPGNSTSSLDYTTSTSQSSVIDTLGTQTTITLWYNMTQNATTQMLGSTQGAARANAKCEANSTASECRLVNMTLQYSTAMASFSLEDGFVSFINSWRGIESKFYHK